MCSLILHWLFLIIEINILNLNVYFVNWKLFLHCILALIVDFLSFIYQTICSCTSFSLKSEHMQKIIHLMHSLSCWKVLQYVHCRPGNVVLYTFTLHNWLEATRKYFFPYKSLQTKVWMQHRNVQIIS